MHTHTQTYRNQNGSAHSLWHTPTNIHAQSPIHIHTHLQGPEWKHTAVALRYDTHVKRDLNICQRHVYIPKETCICQQRKLILFKRDLYISKESRIWQKRPEYSQKRPIHIPKKTWKYQTNLYVYQKRPIYIKRDLSISRESCIWPKRPEYHEKDLCTYKQRPENIPNRSKCTWKETYIHGKRLVYIKRDL